MFFLRQNQGCGFKSHPGKLRVGFVWHKTRESTEYTVLYIHQLWVKLTFITIRFPKRIFHILLKSQLLILQFLVFSPQGCYSMVHMYRDKI